MMHILFICTGNTCRSPMAAALTRHHLAEQGLSWTAESAGLYAVPGQPMASHATDALIRRHVVVPTHRSQPVTPDLVAKADWVFTMTQMHKLDFLQQFPKAAAKAFTLREFLDDPSGIVDVEDPFGGTAETYEACADALNDFTLRLLAKLKQQM